MQTNNYIIVVKIRILKFTFHIVLIFSIMSICSCNQKDNIINEANIEHIDMFDISCDNNIFEIDSIFIEQGYNDDSFKDFKVSNDSGLLLSSSFFNISTILK